jgi:hypothetical protein
MIRFGAVAFFGAFLAAFAALAHSQQTFEPAVPRGLSDTTVRPSGELGQSQTQTQTQTQTFTQTQPAAPQLVMMSPRHAKDSDARQCLRFGNNRQIHRCAERYRPHAARATLTKTNASAAAPGGKERGFKPDLSKAAEPAKAVDTAKAAPPAAAPAAKAAPASTASASAKPAEAPKAASSDKGGKWTDFAKGVVKSQGDHLQEK